MIGICIESSHKRGMGHLYRALNFLEYLKEKNREFIIFANNDKNAISILKQKNILHEIVDLSDLDSDWESALIKKYNITIWVNDRLDTDIKHSLNVIKNNTKLITFDDRGSGAELADLNIAALLFGSENEMIKGKKVLTGIKYLILNKEIEYFKKIRTENKKIIVTLGGSDTYGVTLKIVSILKDLNQKATILIGPSFEHKEELDSILDERFVVKQNIPSLIEELHRYDLAITGGGITPFEANASGLPCLIVANEIWEVDNGQYLEQLGCSRFIGHHQNIAIKLISNNLDIEEMSRIGLQEIKLSGAENIYSEIVKL